MTGAIAPAAAACARSGELRQQSSHLLAEARATRRASEQVRRRRRSSPAGRELMQHSEYARLLARLESMPVIEQAKSILMAQAHCHHGAAFRAFKRIQRRARPRAHAARALRSPAALGPLPQTR